jgi:peptidoglycan hydrolase-like protein with peptidoglycan-binding domain
MKTITLVVSTLALASLAMVSMASAGEPVTSPPPNPYAVESPPAVPDTPAAVEGIIYARKFTLENGYTFDWSKERPVVTSGYLLVLKVDPDLVFPRQVAEPVLYVGAQTAQRVNHGFPSGHVIAIAPGDVDLTKALIWFGTPELPERVDTNEAKAELNLAKAAGIKPFSKAEVDAAQAQASEELKGANVVDVLRVAADLIRQYAPEEQHIAETRVPADKPASTPKTD